MNGRLVPPSRLGAATREEMYALLRTQFPDVPREVFSRDLERKNWVLLLHNGSSAIQGFSTMLYQRSWFHGRELQVVVSGDTVIAEAAAGSSALSKHWIGALNHLRVPDGSPLYWLLLVSGYRTYRFLPVFCREFHPRFDVPTPDGTRELMEHLARAQFGSCFDAASGIVRFPRPQRLRDGLRGIPVHRLRDPHVAYFATRLPGHENGDELVCLAELSRENFTAAGRRMWELGGRLFAAADVVP